MAEIQTTTINVRVNEAIKRDVEELFESMGMNISTAVNMFFRQCLMEEALPFQPGMRVNPTLKHALREAREQTRYNGVSEMSLDDVNSIIAEVRRDKRNRL